MLIKLLYCLFLIILILLSVKLTHFLMKKFKLNRWIIGFVAFLILIIPSIFLNLNAIVWNILLLISAVLCIMFFEITRKMIEDNKYKGLIKNKK